MLRPRYLGFVGQDSTVQLLDIETAKKVRDDPVYGFSQYIVDHGVANIYGKQIFEGNVPLEPSIGAASAIGIVEKAPDGSTKVYRKKQLGIETTTIRDNAKKFHRPEDSKSPYGNVKNIENKTLEKNKQDSEEDIEEEQEEPTVVHEEDIDLTWIRDDKSILMEQQLKDDEPLVLEQQLTEDSENRNVEIVKKYILPIDFEDEEKYEETIDDEDDDISLPWGWVG